MENKNTFLVYGLITGIIMVIINLLLYVTGLILKPNLSWVNWLGYIPFMAGIIMNAIAFSKSKDGYVTFGNVFGSGFKTSVVILLVILVWSTISIFVFPEMKDKIINMQHEQMIAKGMSDDQMDMALNMTRKYWNWFMYIGVSVATLFFGVIFSLIGAASAKKKGAAPMTFDNF